MKLRIAEAAMVLAVLLVSGSPPPAQARGFGGHSFAGHVHRGYFPSAWWRYGFGRYGFGRYGFGRYGYSSRYGYGGSGGVVDYYPSASGYGYAPTYPGYSVPPSIQFVFVATQPRCQPSAETVTVPSEAGGTSQITVRRCTR